MAKDERTIVALTAQFMDKMHNANAEAGVMSVLMQDVDGTSLGSVKEEYFYVKRNRVLYRYLRKINEDQLPIELFGLLARIKQGDDLSNAGGIEYINEVYGYAATDSLFDYHLKLVTDAYHSRCMATLFVDSINEMLTGSPHIDIANKIVSDMTDIFAKGQGGKIDSMPQSIQRVYAEMDNRARSDFFQCSTGFQDVDKLIGTLNQGHIIVLAGRPGMGKSVTGLCIILNNILKGIPCGLINYEMTTEETMLRLLSNVARQPFVDLVNRNVRASDEAESERVYEAIMRTAEKLYGLPLYQRDDVNGTFSECKATITNMVKVYGVRLVLIDYLQLMTLDRATDNANQDIGKIMRGLKILAKQLGIVIIVLSQLNRNLENRKDKRPMLSDLRESGTIEQDADRVLFCYRDDYYNELCSNPNIMELIEAKNRHGRTGVVELYYEKEFSLLAGLSRERDD